MTTGHLPGRAQLRDREREKAPLAEPAAFSGGRAGPEAPAPPPRLRGSARYLGSQTSHLLRQALSLQQELALLAEKVHQLLGCGLAVLVQLLEPADKSSAELGMGPETRGQQAVESKGDSGQLQPFDAFHCCLCPREALVSEPGAVNPGDPEGRGFGQQRALGTSSD